jgi:DinB family protein
MPASTKSPKLVPYDTSAGLLEAFDINDRINLFLLDGLAPEAWRADPPNGKGRTIAAIVAHMHNVRVMWLKAAAKGSAIPEQLVKEKVTPAHAKKALEESREALKNVLQASIASNGKVKRLPPARRGIFRISHRARCSSSRADHHAGPAGRTSCRSENHVRDVGMGKALNQRLRLRLFIHLQ